MSHTINYCLTFSQHLNLQSYKQFDQNSLQCQNYFCRFLTNFCLLEDLGNAPLYFLVSNLYGLYLSILMRLGPLLSKIEGHGLNLRQIINLFAFVLAFPNRCRYNILLQ
jgi:hypothetical protein